LLHFDGLATDPGLTACQTLQLDLPAGASVAVFEVVGAIIGGTQNNPGLGVMKGYVIDPQGHRLNFTTGTGDPVKDMYATARGVLIHDPEPGIWKAFVEPDIATVNQSYWFGYSLDGTGEIQPPQPVLTDPAPC
jgi:hypothetical protein